MQGLASLGAGLLVGVSAACTLLCTLRLASGDAFAGAAAGPLPAESGPQLSAAREVCQGSCGKATAANVIARPVGRGRAGETHDDFCLLKWLGTGFVTGIFLASAAAGLEGDRQSLQNGGEAPEDRGMNACNKAASPPGESSRKRAADRDGSIVSALLFLYTAGWIGWAGRSYLSQGSRLAQVGEEPKLYVSIAVARLASGISWRTGAFSHFQAGDLAKE